MQVRSKTNRSLHRLRDAIKRATGPFEQFEEFRIGPREAGIIFMAAACMLFMASVANAARVGHAPSEQEAALSEDATVVYQTVERLIKRAKSEWVANDHSAVVDTLSIVIAIPSLADRAKAAALLDRGNAYLQMGELSRAVIDFDASLEFTPSEPERVYLLRGMALELQGDREQAAWSYIQALREAPANEAINRHVMRFFTEK